MRVPRGTFTMGSPSGESGRHDGEVQNQVSITRDFWLKETEVTQGEWRAAMGSDPSDFSSCGDDCPVESVTWFDAVDYVNTLSRSVGFRQCYWGSGTSRAFVGLDCEGFRLPTEAEWEYAARAGTSGATYGTLDEIAWYSVNSDGRTHLVRQKRPNAWGLHDMIGNVWEWAHDWYGAYDLGAGSDPVGPVTGAGRVFRGGSWGFGAATCRAAQRDFSVPQFRFHGLGFRVARSIP